MLASAKGRQQQQVRQLQCQEQGTGHIQYYLSGLWQAQISPTTFLEIAVCINIVFVTYQTTGRAPKFLSEQGRMGFPVTSDTCPY